MHILQKQRTSPHVYAIEYTYSQSVVPGRIEGKVDCVPSYQMTRYTSMNAWGPFFYVLALRESQWNAFNTYKPNKKRIGNNAERFRRHRQKRTHTRIKRDTKAESWSRNDRIRAGNATYPQGQEKLEKGATRWALSQFTNRSWKTRPLHHDAFRSVNGREQCPLDGQHEFRFSLSNALPFNIQTQVNTFPGFFDFWEEEVDGTTFAMASRDGTAVSLLPRPFRRNTYAEGL